MEPQFITIRGASEHNLKNISLALPKKKLVVFTGVSGSGKSSLAFDILYAEGQRRYVESLSAYARQFLGQMPKPHFESIRGLSPSISIEQKAASKNPRSTVGTVTEIYDYLRVLYANIGKQHCPRCRKSVSPQSPEEIVRQITGQFKGRIMVIAPLAHNRKGEFRDVLEGLKVDGFERLRIDGQMIRLSEGLPALQKKQKHTLELIVDRVNLAQASRARLVDAVETGLKYGRKLIRIESVEGGQLEDYSEDFACLPCGISFRALVPQSFSFNSPLGMCEACNGLGYRIEVDPDLIVPDDHLSIQEGAVAVWGEKTLEGEGWDGAIVKSLLNHFDIDPHRPWRRLNPKERKLILYGTEGAKFQVEFRSKRDQNEWTFKAAYQGVVNRLRRKFHETRSERARVWYSQFMREMPCEACQGQRLREEVRWVKIGDKSLVELCHMTIHDAHGYFKKLKLSGQEKKIAEEVLKEVQNRLSFLLNVGLDYLTLDRRAPTLSGGENQRIRLASQIGSELSGVLYILDEPSIGLHQRDNVRLLKSLLRLKDLGNSVIVIEHDEETIRAADHIVDFGPAAGVQGGQIVAAGTPRKIERSRNSLTGQYLQGKRWIPVPKKRREGSGRGITILKASENNLRIPTVQFPLGQLVCVTGVSGAGKSSLVNGILYPALARTLNHSILHAGKHKSIQGMENINKVICIDQKPIGKSSRSNPATYTKVYDLIRDFFAKLPASRERGYRPGRFSFNVKGGRCEACEGAGNILVAMHFLPDVYVECEECCGKRFNPSTLEILYKGRHIADILDLTVFEAFQIFTDHPRIRTILKTLVDVGMDYVPLGQPSTTLSGGEAQRIKLSRELCKPATGRTLYILDEPTTGLHFDDIRKFLEVINRLVDQGNTAIVIEHNLDVIKQADTVIDLGPEGGAQGGKIVGIGTPEQLTKNKRSYTGQYLKKVLRRGKGE